MPDQSHETCRPAGARATPIRRSGKVTKINTSHLRTAVASLTALGAAGVGAGALAPQAAYAANGNYCYAVLINPSTDATCQGSEHNPISLNWASLHKYSTNHHNEEAAVDQYNSHHTPQYTSITRGTPDAISSHNWGNAVPRGWNNNFEPFTMILSAVEYW
jgi:hypothetical protein